jgi:glutaconyl-CoA/methylmalonyl-CoA decarboxylase subunit gamma
MSERHGTYEITTGETTRAVTVRLLSESAGIARYALTLGDDAPVEVEVTRPGAGAMTLLLDGASFDVGVVVDDDGFEVDVRGFPHALSVVDPRRKALRTAAGAGAGVVKTQMPGRIVRLLVAEGDAVTKGEPMLVVEAMKMENEIKAPRDGVIKRFAVAAGDVVEAKAVLVELED